MILAWILTAAAQELPELDAVAWQPRVGGASIATVEPERLDGWRASATVDHAQDSLVAAYTDGTRAALVGQLSTGWLGVARGFGPLTLAAQMPVHLWRAGELDEALALAAGDPSVEALVHAPLGPLDAGLSANLVVPTGAAARQLGQPGWSGDLLGAARYAGSALSVTANLGLRVNPLLEDPVVTVDDQLLLRARLARSLGPGELGTELSSVAGLQADAGAATTEGLLSWSQPVHGWRVTGAVGAGVFTSGIGAPAWRALVRVSREAVE